MFWIEPLLALLFALLFTGLLVGAFGWRHPRRTDDAGAAALFSFFLFFLFIWGIGIWAPPFGPALVGVSLLPFLLVGVIVLLVLAATGGESKSRAASMPVREPEERNVEPTAAASAFGGLFWVLMVMLILALLLGYSIR